MIANFEERATLKDGDTVHRPYRSALVAQTYTRNTAVTVQDITATDESLVVNTAKIVPFYVDDLDALQNKWDTVNRFADDASTKLYQFVDADVLGEYDQATSVLDEADFGGTSGNGITITTSNVMQVFARAGKKLDALNIKRQDWFAVISPQIYQVLLEYLGGKESSLGDSTNQNGNVGTFMGFKLYMSNNLSFSAKLLIGTQPTDGDTVTINNVVFTFKTTLGSTAGNVLIGANAAAAITNLVALINAPLTTTAQGVALSAANAAKLGQITATAVSGGLTIKHEGGSYESNGVALAEGLTAAADIWTAALQIQHLLFGQKGAIDVVVQKEPSVEFRMIQDKLGRNVLPWVYYGLKTFAEGKDCLVDVKARTDAY